MSLTILCSPSSILQLARSVPASIFCKRKHARTLVNTSSMASSYNHLVVQQLYEARPSPTLEVNMSLDASSSYSPGHTPCPSLGPSSHSHNKDYFSHSNNDTADEQQAYTRPNSQVLDPVAPPCTPAATPSRRKTITDTNKTATNTATTSTPKTAHQRVASQNGVPAVQVTRTPVKGPVVRCSLDSPKGITDVFSLANDKQLSAQYWFVEEIGYGNWVGHHSLYTL